MRSSIAFIVLLAGCGGENDFDRRAMLASIADEVYIATYSDFVTRADALKTAAHDFCVDRDEESLEALQSAWRGARIAWKHGDAFAFGPYAEVPLRIGPKIDFYPVREETVDELLAGTERLDRELLESQGTPARGLPAMEYLAFMPDGDLSAELARFDDRRCEYVEALADDVLFRGRDIEAAWRDGYRDELVNQTGETYPTLHSAVSEVVSRLTFAVENLITIKIAKAEGTSGSTHPELVESRYSDHSLEELVAALDGVERVYRGEPLGIEDYLEARKPSLLGPVDEAFSRAVQAIRAIEPPLRRAVDDDPEYVATAKEELRTLHRLLGVDVAAALAVTVTFNDTDGD